MNVPGGAAGAGAGAYPQVYPLRQIVPAEYLLHQTDPDAV